MLHYCCLVCGWWRGRVWFWRVHCAVPAWSLLVLLWHRRVFVYLLCVVCPLCCVVAGCRGGPFGVVRVVCWCVWLLLLLWLVVVVLCFCICGLADEMVGVGPYGTTKILGENICREFREKGLCVPIIRPKTFIGTGRLGVFQILYDWVENGKRIPIIGNGRNKYQLLEVGDLVEAIYLMLVEDSKKVNDVFNVGAKEYYTVNHDVGKLCKNAKNGARVFRTPPKILKFFLKIFERLGISPLYEWVYGTADKDSFVSTDKIQKLGWNPKYSNSEALIRSYNWYLENKVDADAKGTGVTHRVAWSQGILGFAKKFM